MFKNLKFHIIAISLICLIVAVMYQVVDSKAPAASTAAVSNRYIRINSASWGLNCNPFILSAKQAQANAPLKKDAHGQVIPTKPLQAVAINNVLESVKKLCEGHPTCEFYASSDILGLDPVDGCFKKLALQYRCFTSDRLIITETNQGELLKIDCAAP